MRKHRNKRGLRRAGATVAIGLMAAGCGASGNNSGSSGHSIPTIGISQIVPAPALDETVQGIKAGLKQHGYVDGKNIHIDVSDADGQISLATSIAQKFVDQHVNVLVSVSTPSGEAAAKAIQGTKVPLVFTAVTDPVTAKIVPSETAPSGNNTTGVYVTSPVAQQLKMIQSIMPTLRSIGVIYDPGEANSVAIVGQLASATQAMGWHLDKVTVASSDEVEAAAESLVGKVGAMYMPQDNTVNEAVGALIKVEQTHRLPLFTDDAESVAKGAIATIGNNNFTMGEQTAALIADVLKGKSAGKITPVPNSVYGVYVNPTAAAGIGLKIPQSVLAKAIKEG